LASLPCPPQSVRWGCQLLPFSFVNL
jgi:hypothetical protein